MRLLILTQYYPPEIGAPQNRLHELAIRIKTLGLDVEVLTAMPNYPQMVIHDEYRSGKIREEEIDGIKVYRSKIFVSKSKAILARLLNYFSFVWTSYWRGRKLKQIDYLMVESPPLFLGYSAIRLSKRMGAKLIFNVSDLWPESAEKMGVVSNKLFLQLAYNLEARCYRKAWLVTGQTQGIVDNIKERFPSVNTHWLPNGVDINFYNPVRIPQGQFREIVGLNEQDVVFFYGGILGHAQGLQVVLNAAKLVEKNSRIKIIIQGSGPEKGELMELKETLQISNVIFRDPVKKSEMPSILKEIDVALVPLRKLDIFEGAIPSKVFEALAMKKPLLLGVDGEARRHFIDQANAGLFYEPENVEALARCMLVMASSPEELTTMGENARNYVSNHFNRDTIAEKFISFFET